MRSAMPWTLLKFLNKARHLPEARILIRLALGLAGAFLLFRVIGNLLDPSDLVITDYVGLVVLTAVGLWLLAAALRGWRE